MDYIIDGFSIPVEYDLCVDGALFYIPDNLPKETFTKLTHCLKAENDVVSITPVFRLQATFRGAKFQKAHDKLVKHYQGLDLKFTIKSSEDNT